MKSHLKASLCQSLPGLLLGVLLGPVSLNHLHAEVNALHPGGVRIEPVITSIRTNSTNVTIQWQGSVGPYQLLHATEMSTNMHWLKQGVAIDARSNTVPAQAARDFYKISIPTPVFGAAVICGDCHTNIYPTYTNTAHSSAIDLLKLAHSETNPACLTCHTVGYGYQYGYKDEATTPYLAGVQCANCHGPAGRHSIYPNDLDKRPVKILAAELCGGCHSGFHHPYYDEWAESGHGVVVPDVASSLLTGGEARMKSCGPCHSGAVRVALVTGKPLPTAQEAATTPITCAVCHDPHGGPFVSQLRNPKSSMDPFNYSTATTTSFAAQYNPNINICGQCHNARGAQWTDTSRPPHHSPQYNILTGTIGFTDGNPVVNSEHTGIDKQCTQCHTHANPVPNPSLSNPNATGHTFIAKLNNCSPCHSEEGARVRIEITQNEISQRIADIKGLLDQWATTMAPDKLKKYGALAWEYSSPGELSNPAGTSGVTGPVTADQALVPNEIKQARFNLYLVAHDLSVGVHNGKYVRLLLQVAENKVNQLLGTP